MARESIPEPVHLRPHADVAERVIVPGDPGRALRLAQVLIDGPKMLNHNRGLWGYSGIAADGAPLTIQSTGIGGPSAAIVIHELIALGARRIVRAGTCGALVDLPLGSLVAADSVIGEDGTSRALGVDGPQAPDPALLAALPGRRGTIVTRDLFYEAGDPGWPGGAIAVEMEAAAVFAVAARLGAAAACVLTVTDRLAGGGRERIGAEALEAAELELGRAALSALAV
jgi:uridine phosphorylase